MKKIIAFVLFALFVVQASAQENSITLSGGYAFADVEEWNINATGWRINGLYEYRPNEGKLAHGFSIGYVNLSAEMIESVNTINYKINSWPIYYAPKFLIGSGNVKGFIKAAIGWQFSHLERTGALASLDDNDAGFTGGGGAGLRYDINDKIFVSGEYELLWMSNSFYKDGLLNTASLGLGFKF